MKKTIYTKKHELLCSELRKARNAAGLTQADVAERLGRPQSFVAKYEGGERRLDVIEFIGVAEATGFDPAEVVRALTGKPGKN